MATQLATNTTATIYCRKQTVYVTSTLDQHMAHCTCCRGSHDKSIRTHPIAVFDEFAIEFGLNPVVAKAIVDQTNHYNADFMHSRKLSPKDYAITMLGIPQSTITPLNVSCRSCGSTFTMLRSDPSTYKSPPTYCIYCASPSLVILSQDTEATAYTVLAAHYNITVPQVKFLYNHWIHQPTYNTFNLFMTSPTGIAVLQVLQPTVPSTN